MPLRPPADAPGGDRWAEGSLVDAYNMGGEGVNIGDLYAAAGTEVLAPLLGDVSELRIEFASADRRQGAWMYDTHLLVQD